MRFPRNPGIPWPNFSPPLTRDLAALTHHRFAQQPDTLRANDFGVTNQKLFGFLDHYARGEM